ncbi:MAG: recombinase family protein [Gemmataceae bacterium]|nr:recombinase family protein [Gemmataceae bacterium]
MTDERKPVAYGYVRVSTERQAREGLSLEEQQERIQRHYEYRLKDTHQWGGFFIDAASASKKPFNRRPAGMKVCAAAESGDAIIITKLDRAFRNMRDLLDTTEAWQKRGVAAHLLDLEVDTTSPTGKLLMHMLCAIAQFESERRGERVRESYALRRTKGILTMRGNKAPYGFKLRKDKKSRWILVPFPEERKVRQKCLELKAAGYSFDQMELWFMKNKVVHPRTHNHIGRGTIQKWIVEETRLQQQESSQLGGESEVNGLPG